MTGVRMDKWLWAARFYKTRSLAARACELGRVECGDQAVRASREVRMGDVLKIRNDSGTFEVKVLALSETRGPAAVARALYEESAESRELRMKEAELRKANQPFGATGEGRPSKRDRRVLERLRNRNG